ncbi:MAG TPA: TonB family protein [Longimicrobiaceae bacterium]|nr:TonB family protein [Longimicrobiaceae bacterium]
MFNNLIASESRKRSVVNSRTLVVSGLAHVALLAGAVYAAANAPKPGERAVEEQVTYVEIEPAPAPEPEPVEPPPPPEMEPEIAPEPEPEPDVPAVVEPSPAPEAPSPSPAPAPPVAKGFQELVPPAGVPDRLPDVDASAPPVKAEDFSGVGVSGGIAKGVEGGEARNTAKAPPTGSKEGDGAGGSPVDVNVVEERPRLQNASEMQRVLQRLYPPMLRDAGVTGQTMLKFVIDASGQVEDGSVEVISTSHDGFANASIQAADRFRFRPAKIGGRSVRVSITMPISWTLDSA